LSTPSAFVSDFCSGNNPRKKKGEIYMIDYRYHIDITCECLLCTQVNDVCVHDESILYNLKDATLHTCALCAIWDDFICEQTVNTQSHGF